MNEWDAIERIINTLPQWDVIKWIMGIQEELKCAKEDNLYQLRQNKNLQSKIDKANEILDKLCVMKPWNDSEEEMRKIYRPIKNTSKQEVYKAICDLRDILKEEKTDEETVQS